MKKRKTSQCQLNWRQVRQHAWSRRFPKYTTAETYLNLRFSSRPISILIWTRYQETRAITKTNEAKHSECKYQCQCDHIVNCREEKLSSKHRLTFKGKRLYFAIGQENNIIHNLARSPQKTFGTLMYWWLILLKHPKILSDTLHCILEDHGNFHVLVLYTATKTDKWTKAVNRSVKITKAGRLQKNHVKLKTSSTHISYDHHPC